MYMCDMYELTWPILIEAPHIYVCVYICIYSYVYVYLYMCELTYPILIEAPLTD